MEIKSKNIISLNLFNSGHSDLSKFYVMGKDDKKYFLKILSFGGEKNGKRHFVLRDDHIWFYTFEELESMDVKIIDDQFNGFKQVRFLTDKEGWTRWVNITPYGDDVKQIKQDIKYEKLNIINQEERDI